MRNHFRLLAQLVDLSPILALRSLSPFELAEYESQDRSPCLTVEDDGPRVLRVDGLPAITADATEERVVLQVVGPVPRDLESLLVAMGMTPGGNAPLSLTGEQFHDRILTLDAAWLLLRRLGIAKDPERAQDLAEDVLALALAWIQNQARICNDGPSDKVEKTEAVLRQQARALAAEMQEIEEIVLLGDPRGAALALKPSQGWEFSVSALVFNWSVGEQRKRPPRRTASLSADPDVFQVRPTPVSSQVQAALRAALCTGKEVRIPGKLSKRDYDAVNDLLAALGGEWKTGAQAHVFQEDAKPLLRKVLADGHYYRRQDFEFFWTSQELARRVIALAGIRPGMTVGEPSAGQGALALLAAEIVGKDNVLVYELMPQNVRVLQQAGFAIDGPTDFLATTPQSAPHVVVMNPPFSGGRDIAHIQHALRWLKPGGTLVAIASTSWQHSSSSSAIAFRALLEELEADVEAIPAGAFSEAGTQVPTVLIKLRKPVGAVLAVEPIVRPAPIAAHGTQLSFF